MHPVAIYHGPLREKFGIPRQSGLAGALEGTVCLRGEYAVPEALRGLEAFDFVWLIWGFSATSRGEWSPTVRPPRLGGNVSVGVFASRSPFRPNGLGLSCVRLDRIEGTVLHVRGADLMDGTPVYDIKPYVAYADARPEARCGFVDEHPWQPLRVSFPPSFPLEGTEREALSQVLAQDPRPSYQQDPDRIYGMAFGPWNIRFRVGPEEVSVLDATRLNR